MKKLLSLSTVFLFTFSNFMNYRTLITLFLTFSFTTLQTFNSFSQGVGINTAGAAANISAGLDVDFTNKGLLIPRITFVQRTGINFNPLPAPAQGLAVYQTDAGGSGEGFYYNTSTTTTPTWVFISSIGPIGPTGATGSQGPQGNVGAQGLQGNVGSQGPQGNVGSQGPQGNVGSQGPVGPVGCASSNYLIKSNGSSAVCSRIYDDGYWAGISPTYGAVNDFWTINQGGGSFGQNGAERILIGWYSGAEPVIQPTNDAKGLCGVIGKAFFRGYSYGWTTLSTRDKKREIISVNDNKTLAEYVMDDIDKIKPSFYKYTIETDEMIKGMESKYRPMMHLGAIVDESPDYIKDESFSAIDNYGIATLSLVGVKYNRQEIKEIKNYLGMEGAGSANISDFGSVKLNNSEIWINFSDGFAKNISSDNLPVITVTSNNSSVTLCVIEKTTTGFKVKASSTVSNLSIDWIAMTKVKTNNPITQKTLGAISPSLYEQLYVPESTKNFLMNYYKNIKSTPTPADN